MKKSGFLLPLILVLAWIVPMQAQTTENLPPQNLSYVRLWTDSIRLAWDQPISTLIQNTPKNKEVEWKELDVEYVGTYRLRSTDRTVLPRNPASDGKYIYMSTWTSSGASVFYKYDLYGTFLEKFTIEGVEKSLRDLAYDGTYFYGGYEGVNKIVILDLANKKLVGGIDVNRPVRHICYIPTLNNGKGGFEIGDFGTSAFIDMEGHILKDSAMEFYVKEDSTYTNSPNKQVYGTAYHNGKIYTHSQLGVMDFTAGMPIPYAGPYSSIIEYDAETGKPTGKRLAISQVEGNFNLPGYAYGAGIEILEFPKGTFKLLLGYQHAFSTSGEDALDAPLVVLDLEKTPLATGLNGYNLYADGRKLNTELIDKNRYSYDLGRVEQGKDIQYELKAVYGAEESASAQTTVNLSDSRLLPFMEDFNSLTLATNYWTMEDTAVTDTKPWHVVEVASIAADIPASRVLDYNAGGANLAFSATVNSRMFDLTENKQVLVRYQVAQNMPYKNMFCDTLFLELNTGSGWKEIDRDTTVYQGKPLTYKTIDISSLAAGKANVSFRFRVKGNSRTEEHPTGYGYNFYIDNFKVWEPVYTSASGAVTFKGEAVENVKVELKKKNDILVYTANSDEDGAFFIENMETGTYELAAIRSDFNAYIEEVEIIDGSNKFDIKLLQPAFSTATDTVKVIMKPDESMRSGFALTNSGTGSMKWNASFVFPESQRKAAEDFGLLESWKARGNVEKSYAYLNDTIYSYYAKSGMVQLLKTTRDGVALEEEIELPFAKYANPTTVFADRSNLYFTQGGNVYKYDKENNCFIDTIKTEISYVSYATWNPVSNTILMGGTNSTHILEMDMDGDTVKLYPVSGLSIQYIAVDPTSADGPVLWVARSYFKPESGIQGEYIGIYEYSLSEGKLTDRYFIANKHPQYVAPVYSQRQTASVAGFFGTTEYFPGRFTLFVTTSLTAMGPISANLCAMYDIAQSVKWIGMETYKGSLAAGESSNFYLQFNTQDLTQGERKTCIVNIKSDINIEPLHLPVVLEVDSLFENPCYTPSGLQHQVEGSGYVDLSWKVETSGGAIVTEEQGLKGFSIMRNGILLTDTLLTEASFRDTDPIMGTNVYQVQAFYEFETTDCSSPWSVADTVKVVYDGTCAGVSNVTAEITNQRHITLMWDFPVNEVDTAECINESFETFDAFRIDSIGHGWTSLDIDRGLTYGINNIVFPHNGEALPFIVYNPMQTTPSSIDRVGAYSGMQAVAAFSSRVEGLTSNDWLISPAIADADASLSLYFMARTAFINYGYEELKVAYSTTGKEVEDFVYLNEGRALNVPGEWTEYSYRLPKGTKYVAFNYVSKNKFMLLIDDIYVGPARHHMYLESYSVYKNDQLLQEITPRAIGFYDFALKDGEYTYEIAAKYNNGCVSEKSEPTVVDIEFKHGITPARGLTASVEDKSINLTWKEPAWGEPQQIGYYDAMKYGFAISDFDGAKLPFYAAIKIDMNDPLLLDYSISALRVGFFDVCKASAVIIDMEKGEYVAEQPIPYVNAGGFTTVSFDNPIKLEMGKSYLVGVHVEDYVEGTYPAGQDNGPLKENYGDYLSIDGMHWSTVSAEYDGEILANWAIDAILEMLDKPAKKTPATIDSRKISFSEWKSENTVLGRSVMPNAIAYQNIEPKAAEPEIAIEGYQLYRDGMTLQKEPQLVFQYEDMDVQKDSVYIYYVKTFYENGESINSDSISVLYYGSSVGNEEEMAAGFGVRVSNKHILIDNKGMDMYGVTVHSLTGTLLYSRNSVKESYLDIPMTNVPSGIYLVGIRQGNTLLVKKIYL